MILSHKEESMKNDHLPVKEEEKEAKRLQRKLDRNAFLANSRKDTRKRTKISQSVNAGHIRGGQAFH